MAIVSPAEIATSLTSECTYATVCTSERESVEASLIAIRRGNQAEGGSDAGASTEPVRAPVRSAASSYPPFSFYISTIYLYTSMYLFHSFFSTHLSFSARTTLCLRYVLFQSLLRTPSSFLLSHFAIYLLVNISGPRNFKKIPPHHVYTQRKKDEQTFSIDR